VEGGQWDAVAALVDPVRRSLFEHVRRQGRPVTREDAADAVAISRNLSAFHLDKLVAVGLLRARYEAPPQQRRGRGRTPKVYEPTDDGLTLSVPPRRYELVGEILADAVAEQPGNARVAAEHHASAVGRRVGKDCRARPNPGADTAAELAAAYAALTDLGFEPRSTGAEDLTLANCPFHALARRQPELICGLNQAFVTGLLGGLGTTTLRARLLPQPGGCCVRVASTHSSA
jgi:predicted ArsR family transcriptional regulator